MQSVQSVVKLVANEIRVIREIRGKENLCNPQELAQPILSVLIYRSQMYLCNQCNQCNLW